MPTVDARLDALEALLANETLFMALTALLDALPKDCNRIIGQVR